MISIIDRTIALPNLTLHYLEAGDPLAPPLILLHGGTSNAHTWDDLIPTLAQHYHVFAPDQRGHGESSRPAHYSFEAMRDDLKAFADALAIDHFTLIGHSMGGTVAFLFAEAWPERLVRLVVEDTPPPIVTSDEDADKADELPDEAPEPVPFDWQALKAIVRQLRAPDPAWWNLLPTITTPTLIIAGGPTSHVPQHLRPRSLACSLPASSSPSRAVAMPSTAIAPLNTRRPSRISSSCRAPFEGSVVVYT